MSQEDFPEAKHRTHTDPCNEYGCVNTVKTCLQESAKYTALHLENFSSRQTRQIFASPPKSEQSAAALSRSFGRVSTRQRKKGLDVCRILQVKALYSVV
jgi:hypothetical protein